MFGFIPIIIPMSNGGGGDPRELLIIPFTLGIYCILGIIYVFFFNKERTFSWRKETFWEKVATGAITYGMIWWMISLFIVLFLYSIKYLFF